MIAWAGWSVLVAALLSVAALGAERALGLYGRPRRWVWLTAMAASLAAPVGLIFLAPAPEVPATVAMLDAPVAVGPPVAPPPAAAPSAGLAERLDAGFPVAWAVASLALLSLLGVATARLARARRRWPLGRLAGVEVLETEDLGPAVIGILRPRIAVPGWVRGLDERLQELVVRHEREHQRAGDSRLLAAGLVSRALLPWCLPLWWQFRRLRLAIELDCDQRVLAAGAPVADYGELLLEVGRRSTGRPLAAVGIFERRSLLERRLRALAPGRPARRLAIALALGFASAAAVVAGATIPQPEPPLTWSSFVMEADTTRERPRVVQVGPEHEDLRSVAELQPLVLGRERDLSGYRIHSREVTRSTSHGCGTDVRDGIVHFWVDPGDPAGDINGHCYLLVPLTGESPEVRTHVTRFDPRHRQASYTTPPRCENCSPSSAGTALERAGAPACQFRVQAYLEVDGSVRYLDVLATEDACVAPLRRWAEDVRWVAGRSDGQTTAGWGTIIGRWNSDRQIAIRPGEWDMQVDTRPAPVDTPPAGPDPLRPPPRDPAGREDRFTFTPYTVKPRCVESCDAAALLAVFEQHVSDDGRCALTLGIQIDTDGRVTGTDVLRPATPACVAAAEAWARTTHWTPALNRDDPVTVWIAQPIQYVGDRRDRQPAGPEIRPDGLTDPDEIARAELRRAMVAQEFHRSRNGEYADALQLGFDPPQTVTLEIRREGDGYSMLIRHDRGTTFYCASSAGGRIVEGRDC